MIPNKRVRWGRLLWTGFVLFYAFHFFKNFFSDAIPGKAVIPIAFFYILTLWLGIEFYFGQPFFQSGMPGIGNNPYRARFAAFFYPTLIYCVVDFSQGWTQLKALSPVINWFGIGLFLLGVVLRLWALYPIVARPDRPPFGYGPYRHTRAPRYIATWIQAVALGLSFSSYLGLMISLAFGSLIIRKEIYWEEERLAGVYGKEWVRYRTQVPILSRFSKR